MLPPPSSSTLFPYTTLFRSVAIFAGLIAINNFHPFLDIVYAKGMYRNPAWVEYARWNAISRIEVDRRNEDRKSTRLNSSHVKNSYAVSCLKKKIRRTSDGWL